MTKILLVEDNEMNRDMISRRLKRAGYEVVMAGDGAEAIEKVKLEHPDLVLMDMGLPILDGYEATRVLKSNAATKAIPILGLSAHAMSGDAAKAMGAGCDDYDTKPVEWPRLRGKIEELLQKSQEQATAETSTEAMGGSESPTSGLRRKVLVANDHVMQRRLLGDRLSQLGHEFEMVETRADLNAALDRGCDALLLSQTLGEAEAQQILVEIAARPSSSRPPVILTCAPDSVEKAVAGLDLGAEDFIRLPFHARVLAVRLERCWHGDSGEASAERTAVGLEPTELMVLEPAAPDPQLEDRVKYLMGVLLPDSMIGELESTGQILPRRYAQVALISANLSGLNRLCDTQEPVETLSKVQVLATAFEDLLGLHRGVQLRSSGSEFLGAIGIYDAVDSPLREAARLALELRNAASRLQVDWNLRIGLHFGSLVVGVIGRRTYRFDAWGSSLDFVRFVREQGGEGEIHLSAPAWEQIAEFSTGSPIGKARVGPQQTVALYRLSALNA